MYLDGSGFRHDFDEMLLEIYNFGLEQSKMNCINFDRLKQLLEEKEFDATEIELLVREFIRGFCKRARY